MTARLASAAFRLALRGLHVFPLVPGTKVPVKGTHGCRNATQDLDVVRAWWQRWPDANIGLATGKASGLWVLDVDVDDAGVGVDGRASLAALEARHGLLPATIQSITPSGGWHLYWRWDVGVHEIRNSAGRVGASLDVRGGGGSAVAPPSLLADGGRYRWARNGAKLADAPAWLVALALALPPPPPTRPSPGSPSTWTIQGDVGRYVAAAISDELRRLAEAVDGCRNDTLNRSAFNVAQFVGAGVVPEPWARQRLEGAAREIGLPVIEIRCTINSAFKAGMMKPKRLPE